MIKNFFNTELKFCMNLLSCSFVTTLRVPLSSYGICAVKCQIFFSLQFFPISCYDCDQRCLRLIYAVQWVKEQLVCLLLRPLWLWLCKVAQTVHNTAVRMTQNHSSTHPSYVLEFVSMYLQQKFNFTINHFSLHSLVLLISCSFALLTRAKYSCTFTLSGILMRSSQISVFILVLPHCIFRKTLRKTGQAVLKC